MASAFDKFSEDLGNNLVEAAKQNDLTVTPEQKDTLITAIKTAGEKAITDEKFTALNPKQQAEYIVNEVSKDPKAEKAIDEISNSSPAGSLASSYIKGQLVSKATEALTSELSKPENMAALKLAQEQQQSATIREPQRATPAKGEESSAGIGVSAQSKDDERAKAAMQEQASKPSEKPGPESDKEIAGLKDSIKSSIKSNDAAIAQADKFLKEDFSKVVPAEVKTAVENTRAVATKANESNQAMDKYIDEMQKNGKSAKEVKDGIEAIHKEAFKDANGKPLDGVKVEGTQVKIDMSKVKDAKAVQEAIDRAKDSFEKNAAALEKGKSQEQGKDGITITKPGQDVAPEGKQQAPENKEPAPVKTPETKAPDTKAPDVKVPEAKGQVTEEQFKQAVKDIDAAAKSGDKIAVGEMQKLQENAKTVQTYLEQKGTDGIKAGEDLKTTATKLAVGNVALEHVKSEAGKVAGQHNDYATGKENQQISKAMSEIGKAVQSDNALTMNEVQKIKDNAQAVQSALEARQERGQALTQEQGQMLKGAKELANPPADLNVAEIPKKVTELQTQHQVNELKATAEQIATAAAPAIDAVKQAAAPVIEQATQMAKSVMETGQAVAKGLASALKPTREQVDEQIAAGKREASGNDVAMAINRLNDGVTYSSGKDKPQATVGAEGKGQPSPESQKTAETEVASQKPGAPANNERGRPTPELNGEQTQGPAVKQTGGPAPQVASKSTGASR